MKKEEKKLTKEVSKKDSKKQATIKKNDTKEKKKRDNIFKVIGKYFKGVFPKIFIPKKQSIGIQKPANVIYGFRSMFGNVLL